MKQFEQRLRSKTVAQKIDYESFLLSDVRYHDDHKLPLRLVKDIPFIISRLSFKSILCSNVGDTQKGVKQGENELFRFYENNKYGVANMAVYLFWICTSIVFDDMEMCSFPVEFIDEIRVALLD